MIVVIISTHLRKLIHQYGELVNVPSEEGFFPLQEWLKQHDCILEPTFPEIDDEKLQEYYQLKSVKEINESNIEALRQLKGIEGAYKKADESLPH